METYRYTQVSTDRRIYEVRKGNTLIGWVKECPSGDWEHQSVLRVDEEFPNHFKGCFGEKEFAAIALEEDVCESYRRAQRLVENIGMRPIAQPFT